MKRRIGYLFKIVITNIRLFICKILHIYRIKYHFLNIVSNKATIKTNGAGKVFLGKMVIINSNVEISANNGIVQLDGDNCISRNTSIVAHKKIKIGRGTTIGPNCCIYDHDHNSNNGFVAKEITIGENVWIGAGCIILKGISIGDNTIIGAGSLVSKNVGNNIIYTQKRVSKTREKNEYRKN